MSIHVGNLSYEVTEAGLTQVFSGYGIVKHIQLNADLETDRLRGCAFIEMGTETEEIAAIEALDGAEWMGHALKVNKTKLREE